MKLPPEIVKVIMDWMGQFNGPGGLAGWAFRQMGGRKWLRERALRAPKAAVLSLGKRKVQILHDLSAAFPTLPPEELDWRAFELTVAEAAEQKTIDALEKGLTILDVFPGLKL